MTMLSKKRKLLFFLSLVFYCAVSFSAPLTLKESVEYALKHSPAFSSSKVKRSLSDLNIEDKRSAFLPSLDVDSTIGLTKAKTSFPEEPWTSSLNLKLTETLYDNGKSITLLNKSSLERDIAELTVQKERDKLCLDVATLLYDFSSNKKLVEAKKEQYDLIQKQFTDAGNQYKGGLKTRRDYLRFKTEAQSAELSQRLAENTTEKLKTNLRRLLGDDQNKIEFAVLEVETLPHSFPTAPSNFTNTYEYRINELTAKLANFDVTLAKRAYWPSLLLAGGATYTNNNYINSTSNFSATESYNANIGLTLSFNLWDWGVRKREIERAESQVLINEYSVKSKELEMQEELKNLFLDLETAKATYALSQEYLNAQADAYKLIRRDYRDGQAQYTDLIDSLTKLLVAKTSFFQSRYQLAGAIAKNLYYEGKIYETLLK